jgi:hypothetical protein
MLDPTWLAGRHGYARRASLKTLVILRNDQVSPAVVELSREEALRILESGEPGGAVRAAGARPQPFFNPHLLVINEDKLAGQRMFFSRLLEQAQVRCFLVNSGVANAAALLSLF